MSGTVYTIGHSNHEIGHFLDLLQSAQITAVADVRSQPFSRLHPQFNRDALRRELKGRGVAYAFLGAELGARSNDESCYVDGRVQYERLAQTALFRSGLDRVQRGSQEYRVALVCAERDPLTCHRAILVGYELSKRGVSVLHLGPNGQIETHVDATRRLIDEQGYQPSALFASAAQLEADAYAARAAEIAYERTHPHQSLLNTGSK